MPSSDGQRFSRPNARIPLTDVAMLRRLHQRDPSQWSVKHLAISYGVARSSMWCLLRGFSYAAVGDFANRPISATLMRLLAQS